MISTTTGTVTTTFAGSVEQRFVKLLHESIEQIRDILQAGQLANFEQYKYHAGMLQGLMTARTAWEQAHSDVQKSEGSLRRAI